MRRNLSAIRKSEQIEIEGNQERIREEQQLVIAGALAASLPTHPVTQVVAGGGHDGMLSWRLMVELRGARRCMRLAFYLSFVRSGEVLGI